MPRFVKMMWPAVLVAVLLAVAGRAGRRPAGGSRDRLRSAGGPAGR